MSSTLAEPTELYVYELGTYLELLGTGEVSIRIKEIKSNETASRQRTAARGSTNVTGRRCIMDATHIHAP
jgi:hypothetical protein